ncbi:MAG: TOBE domain-containing protein [Burkholderiaceae bacterium]
MRKPALQLAEALGHESSDKRIDILRRLDAAGSISEAARGAGVSYKAAWQAIETLSNLAGASLVDKAVGGSGGGGARLTADGERVLRAADLMAQARAEVLARIENGNATSAPSIAALGLRTSMRNHLPCSIRSIRPASGQMRVELVLADGTLLGSRITRESVQLLGLAPGQAVLALCKATAVRVAAEIEPATGCNCLAGTVARASRSASGGEVSLSLASGLQLVGFAAAASGLKKGDPAVAAIDEAGVVIAVSD